MDDERPQEEWPGFSPEEVRAQEEELHHEPGTVTAEPQGAPSRSGAARNVAILGILALLALLGLAAALLVLGADDPSGASAASHRSPGGGNGAQPPSASTGTELTTTTDSATTTDMNTDSASTSTGSPPVAVPDVVGDPASQATRRLRNADLRPETRLVTSSRAPGTVVKQTPSAGNRLASGGVVTLDVAKARPVVTVRVPQLVGRTVPEAKQSLRSVALGSSVTTVSSSKPAGTVLSQSPAAGAKVRRGSVVSLLVSTGPALVTVPDVTGLDERDARAALRRDGFDVEVVDQPTDDSSQDGVVVDQSPTGSTDAREGSTVTITVARFSSGP